MKIPLSFGQHVTLTVQVESRLGPCAVGERSFSKNQLIPVVVFLAGFFVFVARHRFIDGDEGFYLLASRLVMQHKTPYLDFFHTQAPLLPYAYGLWMKLFGISWFSARIFSAALTTVLGLLIYVYVWRETQRWIASLAAIVLFASSTLIFAWFPIAKTYSLATLFLFSAYVIVTRGGAPTGVSAAASSRWPLAVAGLLFGLSVDTRSYVVGLAPIFVWWIFRHRPTRNGIAGALWFLSGFAIGAVPCLYFLVSSHDLFLFNNLGFHALRSSAEFIGDWSGKLEIARKVLFGTEDNGVQFNTLLVVSFVAILASGIRIGATLLAFLIAFVLGFISILPTPPFVQYFCMCMPFLIVATVCGINNYVASLRAVRAKRIMYLASITVLAGFVASSVPSFRRYLITGDRVLGMADTNDAQNWTMDKVTQVSKAIDELAVTNEQIASFWPGYIFTSKATAYTGFENDFGWIITNKLMSDQRAKYHIIGRTEIEIDFAAHTPRIAVVGNQRNSSGAAFQNTCQRILRSNGYTAERTIGDTSVWVCCKSEPPAR